MSNRTQITRLIALAGLAIPTLALATPRSWTNAAGGAAATSTNWSPVAVPAAADILNYNLAGSYSVSFNAAVPTDAQNNFSAGTVAISASSPHTTTGQFVVGLGGASTVNLISGAFNDAGTIALGSSGAGLLTVTGPTSSLTGTSAAGSLRVGNGSTGTLNMFLGGLVQSAGPVLVGAFGSSQGSVFINGISGTTHSRLITTDPTAGDITIAAAGNGSMVVTNGGQVTCADDFSIAPTAGFTGTVTVGTNAASTVGITGDLLIANNATAAAAGTGTLDIQIAGVITVGGTTRVGDANGGLGTLHMSGNGTLRTSGLTIDAAHGVLQHDNGQIRVAFAPCVLGTPGLTINGAAAGDAPDLSIESGSTLTLTSALIIGSTRQGSLSVLGVGAVVTADGSQGIILGQSGAGSGTLDVSGFGRVTGPFGTRVIVGQNGAGTLDISANGTVEAMNCDIGAQGTGSGVVTVDGSSSLLDLSFDLYVGGKSNGPAGAGSLTISNGGLVSAANNATVWGGTGTLAITSGTLTVGGALTLNPAATCTMTTGTINATTVNLNGGTLTASGLINAAVSFAVSGSTIAASGPLTLGRANATGGEGFGELTVGAHTVTYLDSGYAEPGSININGGTLNAPNGTAILAARSLTGTGVINNSVINEGRITPTGANGLTFTGFVNQTGQGIAGSTITFAGGSGFAGHGAINTQVFALDGSTITATNGNLNLGASTTAPDACTIGGTLHTGTSTVRLFDAVRPLITGTVQLEGGTLASGVSGVQLKRIGAPVAAIRGTGTISNPLYNNGLVSPGSLTGDRTQTIFPTGIYDQHGLAPAAPGTLEVDIEGSAAGEFDQIQVISGNAVLDGTLIVNRLNGFYPGPGQQFTIFSANSVTGTFAAVFAPGFQVIYTPTSVQLIFIGLCDSADFDCDEDFGTDADIEAFFRCLGGVCPSNCGNDADFNNDGDFGTDADIEAFFRVLAGGSCF